MADDDNKWGYWKALNDDLLAIIFKKIPVDELMRIVPFVCREWREAVQRPNCWSEINIMKWSKETFYKGIDNESFYKGIDASHGTFYKDKVDIAVRYLVHLSGHNLRSFSAYGLENEAFSFIASFGNHLTVLEIPMCMVNDSTLEKSSGSLKVLKILDISLCHKITSKGIEILGKNCTSLIHLRRNMFLGYHKVVISIGGFSGGEEDEALAVANTMFGLEHLELEYGCFSDRGLEAILNNCKKLSFLNIRHCQNVQLVGNVGKRCYALESFINPLDDLFEVD